MTRTKIMTREKTKDEKYEELQEQYIEGEISDDELERQMNDLFESGDKFLEEKTTEPILTDEMRFRLREIRQLLVALGVVGSFALLVILTKGIAVVPLIAIYGIALVAYLRYKGMI